MMIGIVLSVIIGIAIGAVVLYVVMDKRLDVLRVALAKKETEVEMMKTTKEQLHDMGMLLANAQAQRLKEENKENLGSITQPLKDAITNMQKAIHENQKESAAHSASFREQMIQMMQQTQQLGEKAESLTNVLRRDNKVSGNMGEIILGDLLASQGLTEGIHYEVQARLRDELGRPLKNEDTGKEMQPDVILHYPQGQDAIVDSKVSLVAYEKYVNAKTPEEKDRYLQEHIKSVRSHVNELARKDYSKYIKNGRETVDFVIMFVPFESSLQLALANDPTLWREAFEKKVFVTGEQNLLGILHMIHIAWVQNQQAENQEKVFGIAEQLLDRLGDFIQRYQKVGEQLDLAHRAYEAAGNKLFTGRQSVVQKGRELIDLGGKENPNRRIPKAEERPDALPE
ncbi:MAG: DNA recombination protein RmuC [Prevotella sp.]|nr:DNA recombination protein RmuC [Prevotella sp.]